MPRFNRRSFLKVAGAATAGSLVSTKLQALAGVYGEGRKIGANDNINLALIGAGIQGQGDTTTAIKVPGVKLVAVADCYQGRLDHAKELWRSEAGDNIFTTRDYREILARPDVDAVIVATPDHWHKQASVDAMKAGKDVYCEKPMIHLYEDGPEMIETANSTKRILQVGSQRVSSALYIKAKELLAAGAIGELNMVTARWDRNSSMGAWNYTVPLDASTETCDWPRFLGSAPKIPWNPEHFFQWRKWKAYGSGVAGDLFVHLFSGTHFITGAKGPTRAVASGALRFWKDGRDVPDVMLGIFDYPEGFNLSLRVNFVDGGEESEGLLFTGSEGTMEIGHKGVTVNHSPREKGPGQTVFTYTEAMQKRLIDEYKKKYPDDHSNKVEIGDETFVPPEGYSDSYDHFHNFFNSVRSRKQPVEDGVFGFRAAGAALLANLSYEKDAVVHWDPVAMKVV